MTFSKGDLVVFDHWYERAETKKNVPLLFLKRIKKMLKKGDLVYFMKRGNSANGHLLEEEEVDKSGGPGLVLAVWDEEVVLNYKINPDWVRVNQMGSQQRYIELAKTPKTIPDVTEMRTVAKIHWQKPRKVQTKFSTGEDNKHITVDFVERYVKVEDC